MAPVDRDNMLRVRISDDELKWLKWMADSDGQTLSDFIRQLVRKTYFERQAALADSVLKKSKRK